MSIIRYLLAHWPCHRQNSGAKERTKSRNSSTSSSHQILQLSRQMLKSAPIRGSENQCYDIITKIPTITSCKYTFNCFDCWEKVEMHIDLPAGHYLPRNQNTKMTVILEQYWTDHNEIQVDIRYVELDIELCVRKPSLALRVGPTDDDRYAITLWLVWNSRYVQKSFPNIPQPIELSSAYLVIRLKMSRMWVCNAIDYRDLSDDMNLERVPRARTGPACIYKFKSHRVQYHGCFITFQNRGERVRGDDKCVQESGF